MFIYSYITCGSSAKEMTSPACSNEICVHWS